MYIKIYYFSFTDIVDIYHIFCCSVEVQYLFYGFSADYCLLVANHTSPIVEHESHVTTDRQQLTL
ncbi:hypothetical protein DWW91_07975 [Parabacteroides sp. AF17-3]|nr:hypothetical protein DWW91_07975 [Parabacteroides sp. AF17-3]